MKKLLSLLMCYVFLQAQTFALRGGPSGRNDVEKITGVYSGTVVETVPAVNITSLGLFLLTAADTGASTGQIVFFSSSAVDVATYSGTIAGLSNPNTGTFTGVLGASDATGQLGTQTISGQLSCTAKKAVNGSSTQTISGTATARSVNIVIAGSNILKTIGNVTAYTVEGWRTSASSTGTPLPTVF